MDFKNRKKLFAPIADYLKSDDCSIENLLGLRASLQTAMVAVENRIRYLRKQRDRLISKVKDFDEIDYLD